MFLCNWQWCPAENKLIAVEGQRSLICWANHYFELTVTDKIQSITHHTSPSPLMSSNYCNIMLLQLDTIYMCLVIFSFSCVILANEAPGIGMVTTNKNAIDDLRSIWIILLIYLLYFIRNLWRTNIVTNDIGDTNLMLLKTFKRGRLYFQIYINHTRNK